jgi:hypothetical protein
MMSIQYLDIRSSYNHQKLMEDHYALHARAAPIHRVAFGPCAGQKLLSFHPGDRQRLIRQHNYSEIYQQIEFQSVELRYRNVCGMTLAHFPQTAQLAQ